MASVPGEHDDERFERVVRLYGAPLARLCAAYAHERHDRDDLMQEVLFALWRALPAFRGDCSERTFVYRIAHNRALTWRRTASRHHAPLDDADSIADWRADPAATAFANDGAERLLAAIRRLPDVYREVLLLRLEDLSNGEIAQVLGVNENVVAIRLTRARKALGSLPGVLHD